MENSIIIRNFIKFLLIGLSVIIVTIYLFVLQFYIKIISGDVDDLEQVTVKIYCESSIDNPYIIEIEKTSDLERLYNTITKTKNKGAE